MCEMASAWGQGWQGPQDHLIFAALMLGKGICCVKPKLRMALVPTPPWRRPFGLLSPNLGMFWGGLGWFAGEGEGMKPGSWAADVRGCVPGMLRAAVGTMAFCFQEASIALSADVSCKACLGRGLVQSPRSWGHRELPESCTVSGEPPVLIPAAAVLSLLPCTSSGDAGRHSVPQYGCSFSSCNFLKWGLGSEKHFPPSAWGPPHWLRDADVGH